MKIAFYVVTGLLAALLMFSVIGSYFLNTGAVQEAFEVLGYPAYMVIPLGIFKIIGVAVLLTRFDKTLVEWAYAGFTINFGLAASAHLNAGDGQAMGAFVALVLLAASYLLQCRVFA